MKLYYYQDPIGNFGDDLNLWLWPQLFPKSIDQCLDDETLFIGIGSLLNHKIPQRPPKKIVFGSGCGYGRLPALTSQWRFLCVRGPLTADLLNLPASSAVTDSAMLVRLLKEPNPRSDGLAAFMPHHQSKKYDDWKSICDSLSIRYIDPADDVDHTIEAIRTSSVLITEAMHGAIVADALRVPWIPVRTRPLIIDFKWHDWSRSIAIEHEFEWLPRAWSTTIDSTLKRRLHPLSARLARERLRWLVRYGRTRLSTDSAFHSTYSRLTTTLHDFVGELL